jgi:hypothetical protein
MRGTKKRTGNHDTKSRSPVKGEEPDEATKGFRRSSDIVVPQLGEVGPAREALAVRNRNPFDR